MRIAVVTWGPARGDFQPFLALAVGLHQAGHEVTIGVQPDRRFADLAAQAGVPFAGLGAPTDDIATSDTYARALRSTDPLDAIRIVNERLLIPKLQEMYRDCLELAREADVVVANYLQPVGRMAAELLGRPFVSATYDPSLIPTRYFPPLGMRSLGKAANVVLWQVMCQRFDRRLGNAAINRLREQLGLPRLRPIVGDGFYSPDLNLVEVSRHVVEPPPDWARHRLTGSWFLDQPAAPPPALEEFLSSGPKPVLVYLGFGGTLERDRLGLVRMLVSAIGRSGARAVLELDPADLAGIDVPPTIVPVTGVPHAWLLPRVAAIVHHGGAGTTHSAIRAGIPSIVVPYYGDQPFWAYAAARLGVAGDVIPRPQLTAPRLAQAIVHAAHDAELHARAADLGAHVRAEDGVRTAVRLIEQFVARK